MGLQRLKKEIHGFKTLSCFSFKLVFITQISEPQKPVLTFPVLLR